MKNITSNIFNNLFANRILANLMMVGLVVLGFYSYQNIRLSLYPDVDYAWTNIQIVYPGAQPEIVEEEITNVIEKEIGSIENVDLTMSVTTDQFCIIYLRAKFGLKDPDTVFNEIVRRVNNVDLPKRAEKPKFQSVSTSSVPILKIGLTSKIEGNHELVQERLLTAARQLETQLNRVKGISKINFFGKASQTIQIEVDPYKLKEYGLSMDFLAQFIDGGNYDSPGGSLRVGNETFSLRLKGRFTDIDDIRNLTIPFNQGVIQLKNIAKIKKVFEEPRELVSVNLKQGVILGILKGDGVDTVKLIKEIRSTLDGIQEKLPAGIEISYYADASIDIMKLLSVLESSSILGLIFVFLVLWVIIGFRQAIFASIGIPVAFCFCMCLLYFMDASLNQITLFGFVLVLGVVVDDAIVIIENIYSKLEKGLYPYYAVKEGLKEIWLPVVSATLTTMAAFAPIFLTTGPVGNLISFISVVVCLTLIGSLLECFFMLPSHMIEGTDDGADARPEEKFKGLKILVMKVAKYSIRHGGKISISIIVITSIAIGSLLMINKELFSNEDLRGFRVGIKTPNGTDIHKTEEIVGKFSKLIYKKYQNNISSIAHFAGIFQADAFGTMVFRDSNYGQIYIELKDDADLRMEELMILTKKDIAEIPGIAMSWFVKLENAPVPENEVEIVLRGDDYETLQKMSKALHDFYKTQKGIVNVFDDRYMGNQQIRVIVDRKRAALHGLTNKNLGLNIYRALEGQNVGKMVPLDGSDDWDITLLIDESAKEDMTQIKNMSIRTPSGKFISLNEIAELEKSLGPSVIGHYNQKKSINVKASVDSSITSLNEVSKNVEKIFPELENKFNGTTAQFIGASDDIKASFVELGLCFLLSTFLVYSILAIQFNSFTQPFLIMVMIPVGLIGVAISMFIGGNPLSLFIFIGIIGLSGVIVNDSLVLISFFNNAIAAGKALPRAVMEGVSRRYRPILMTTVTTVAGLTPAALGLTGKSLVWQPLAQTFIGGMIVATLGTLFVLPYSYIVLNNLFNKLKKRKLIKAKQ
ncbi:MAG: hypothetical protein COA79_10750 [Planctomycetota bacterium]|nr:MAG: hypothetical protein COA79_10750 [Planctomycetota bacterium]